MHFGILVFPGTNCDRDCHHVVTQVLGHQASYVWHESPDLSPYDVVILPGGFAHGDYLRTGAIARFSPVMDAVAEFARLGKSVLGICNGFQILCEAGLLPGALRRNDGRHFICHEAFLRVERNDNQFLHQTNAGEVLQMPIRHGEGNYYVDKQTLAKMEKSGQILLRYADASATVAPDTNPNGSVDNIAGVMNEDGTVFGLMPHPEAAMESLVGSEDGLKLFHGLVTPLSI